MSWEPGEPSPMPPTPRPTLPTPIGLLVGFSWKLSKEWHGKEVSLVYKLLAFGGLYHRNKELYKLLSLSSNAIFVQYMLLVWSMGGRGGGGWLSQFYTIQRSVPAPHTPPHLPPHRPPHPFSLISRSS
jgi:hypothetical protein